MAAHQAPPSLGFSRQEHWSGLPFPSPMHESEKWKWSRWVLSNQAPLSMGFSRQECWSGVPLPSPVWMLELYYKEGRVLKNWCFWITVLEKTLESPLDSREIQPVHPKGNQSWIFIGRTDAEAETPILWPPVWRTDSFEKTLMLRRIESGRRRWRQRMRWLAASPTQWMWVCVNSRSWWWTGKPRVLRLMGLQRVGHNWVTELNLITLRQVWCSCHRIQLLARIPYGSVVVLVFWGEYPKGISFLFKKGKRKSDHWNAPRKVSSSSSLLRP